VHRHAEVLDRHPDGRPHQVKATVKIMGITDKELLAEFLIKRAKKIVLDAAIDRLRCRVTRNHG
jgi:transcription elongation factor GreA-like protein